jgi:Rrf2 family nitric oxide-sensitive transcriptional repressor
MRLTLHTDFALRVLIQVALNEGELTTINDIAKSSDISKNHLMKLVNDLSQKGYLDTVRGRNGGIRLMRKPRDINVGQVVRDTEDRLDVIGCLDHTGFCRIERVCVLRGVSVAFLAVLDAHTLADLIKPHRPYRHFYLGRACRRVWSRPPAHDNDGQRSQPADLSKSRQGHHSRWTQLALGVHRAVKILPPCDLSHILIR